MLAEIYPKPELGTPAAVNVCVAKGLDELGLPHTRRLKILVYSTRSSRVIPSRKRKILPSDACSLGKRLPR